MNVYTPGFRILYTDSKGRATHPFNYCPFGYDYLLIISSIVPKRYLVRTTMDDKIVNPTHNRRPSNNTRLRANPYTTPNPSPPPSDLSPWGRVMGLAITASFPSPGRKSLSTVSPFVTAHIFCASRGGLRNSSFLGTVPSKC